MIVWIGSGVLWQWFVSILVMSVADNAGDIAEEANKHLHETASKETCLQILQSSVCASYQYLPRN